MNVPVDYNGKHYPTMKDFADDVGIPRWKVKEYLMSIGEYHVPEKGKKYTHRRKRIVYHKQVFTSLASLADHVGATNKKRLGVFIEKHGTEKGIREYMIDQRQRRLKQADKDK